MPKKHIAIDYVYSDTSIYIVDLLNRPTEQPMMLLFTEKIGATEEEKEPLLVYAERILLHVLSDKIMQEDMTDPEFDEYLKKAYEEMGCEPLPVNSVPGMVTLGEPIIFESVEDFEKYADAHLESDNSLFEENFQDYLIVGRFIETIVDFNPPVTDMEPPQEIEPSTFWNVDTSANFQALVREIHDERKRLKLDDWKENA